MLEPQLLNGWELRPEVDAMAPSAIREALKTASRPGVISFAGGLPDPRLFPLRELRIAIDDIFMIHGAAAMQYSITQGVLSLRERLAERATGRGAATDAANLLIISGAQQGLEMIAHALINPGETIITEQPTYIGALQAFTHYGAKYVSVPMDDDGMQVEALPELIDKHHPKLIYTVPDFQNPSGRSLSQARRERLVEIADHYGLPIIDDSPYADIRFADEKPLSVKAIGGDSVIALRTLSKLIAPGLRIGWINARHELIVKLERLKQCLDLHTNTLGQYVMNTFLMRGLFEPHVKSLRVAYKKKRDAMLTELDRTMPAAVSFTRPEGGLFLWVELPNDLDATDLLPRAVDQQVAYVPGAPFFPNGGGENCLRLSFSSARPDEIRTGVQRLAGLFREILDQRESSDSATAVSRAGAGSTK